MSTANLKKEKILTKEVLDKFFVYDAESGKVLRIARVNGKCKKIKEAGWVTDKGYRAIQFNGFTYYTHRIVWALVKGVYPQKELDHINGKRDDNRLENLRECTRQENMRNQSKRKKTSIFIGVHWDKQAQKWRADYRNEAGILNFIGHYVDEVEAGLRAEKYMREVKKNFFNEKTSVQAILNKQKEN